VRNCRDQPVAVEIFRQELLKTSLGDWFAAPATDAHRVLRQGYSAEELSSRISVAIVAEDRSARSQEFTNTIESVRNMADEIVLVGPSASNGLFDVWETIHPRRATDENLPTQIESSRLSVRRNYLRPSSCREPRADSLAHRKLRHPWVLVLQVGECATPDMVRQLPERIVDWTDCDAVRIPKDKRLFNQSTHRFHKPQLTPIRVFHQDRCRFSLQNGALKITADCDRTQILDAKIGLFARICG